MAALSNDMAASAQTANVVSLEAYLAAPAPRAVGARSSRYTIALHEKYQGLAIPRPDFVFGGSGVEGWSAKVKFTGLLGEGGDVEVQEHGLFASKQEAKERLSEKALSVLEELEAEGKIGKRQAEKQVGPQKAAQLEQGKEPVVNYVGQLLEFQRSTNSPQPTFTDFQLGTLFSCELIIDSEPEAFGGRNVIFTSKKEARRNAARCAIDHFKAVQRWPDTTSDGSGIKKKKKTPAPVVTSAPADSANTKACAIPPGASYPSQVAQLAAQLAFPPPAWVMTPVVAAPGFYTVSCMFKDHVPPEVGKVQHMLGKKKAKEECARQTLQYLLSVKEQRLQFGKRTMEGVVGGGSMSEVALHQPMGGERGIEDAVLGRSAAMQKLHTSESDDDFEDALE